MLQNGVRIGIRMIINNEKHIIDESVALLFGVVFLDMHTETKDC